jgi:hypothetical protein
MKTAIVICNGLAAILSLLSAISQYAEGRFVNATLSAIAAYFFFGAFLIWANNKNQ